MKDNKSKITESLLGGVFSSLTYIIIKEICSNKTLSDFNGNKKEIHEEKDILIANMLVSALERNVLVSILVSELGIDSFCGKWVDFIREENDKIRISASGEFETLNLKINYFINKIISSNVWAV